MGSPRVETGRSLNENQVMVQLTRGFWMAQIPVTQGLYKKVAGGMPADQDQTGENYPVTQVDWTTCDHFTAQLTKLFHKDGVLNANWRVELPTEAELEYACRAGTDAPWFCGPNESFLKDYAWYEHNAGGNLQPTGMKRPNGWNLHDMSGLVWEWCADWYDETLRGGTDPHGPDSASSRVTRGGSFVIAASDCRSACRGKITPDSRYYFQGLRLALRAVQSSR